MAENMIDPPEYVGNDSPGSAAENLAVYVGDCGSSDSLTISDAVAEFRW